MNTPQAMETEVPRLPFGPQFSFFRKPIWNTAPLKDITLYDAYAYIKGDYAKEQTERLRSIPDKKTADAYKAKNFTLVEGDETLSTGFTIAQAEAKLTWGATTFTYNGKELKLNMGAEGMEMIFEKTN